MRKNPLQSVGPILMLMYGGMIMYYYFAGFLGFLINPFYNFLVMGGGIVLLLIGGYWTLKLKKFKLGSCESQSKFEQWSFFILLIIPLIFGLIFKPQLLSSTSALARGVSSDLAVSDFDPTVFSKPTKERSLIEWVRILNINPEPDHYKDQEVIVEGTVIFDENMPENMFQIGRFVMTCCAADARVIALPVIFEAGQFKGMNDQWIELRGKMTEVNIDEHRQVVIDFESFKEIPTPENAYEILK